MTSVLSTSIKNIPEVWAQGHFSPFSTLQKLFENVEFLDMMNMCIGSVRNDEAKLVMSGCVPAKYMSC